MPRGLLAALLVGLVVVGAGCSSDNGDKKNASTTTSSPPTTELSDVPTTFTGGDKPAFCAAFVEMELPKNKHLTGNTADDVRAYYRRRAAFVVRMQRTASNEIRASVANHLWFNNRIVRSGKITDLADSNLVQNTKIVYGYATAQCGLPERTTTTSTTAPTR